MNRKNGLGKGLGKGLGALIPVDNAGEVDKSEEKKENNRKLSTKQARNVENPVDNLVIEVNINKIEPNPGQPRTSFDDETLQELAQSISQHGVLQPLLVTKKGSFYELVAGERRWRAAKLAGLKKLPVIVKELSEKEKKEIALIENIQREDLNVIEEARAYQRLIEEFSMKQEELAARINKSRSAIANRMRLLKLCDKVLDMTAKGVISEGHARALLAVESEALQLETAMQIVEKGLNVRETEKLIKRLLTPAPAKTDAESDWKSRDKVIYDDIELKLRAHLGTKVSIHRTEPDKGKIQVEYYSIEELERLIELFKRAGEQ